MKHNHLGKTKKATDHPTQGSYTNVTMYRAIWQRSSMASMRASEVENSSASATLPRYSGESE
jgi:hypothetical protein